MFEFDSRARSCGDEAYGLRLAQQMRQVSHQRVLVTGDAPRRCRFWRDFLSRGSGPGNVRHAVADAADIAAATRLCLSRGPSAFLMPKRPGFGRPNRVGAGSGRRPRFASATAIEGRVARFDTERSRSCDHKHVDEGHDRVISRRVLAPPPETAFNGLTALPGVVALAQE